jgi:cytochrome c oxidase cbb3-type subunit 3
MNSGHIMFSRSWVRLEDIVSVAAALARRPRKLARGKWNAKGRTSVPTYLRLVVLTTFYAAALPQVRQIPASHSSSDAALIEGGQIFAARCASCHGLDGHGGERAPDIVARRDVQKLSDAALLRIVRKGVPGTGMPAFRSLGDSRTQAVVRHLRNLQGRGAISVLPGLPKAGKVLFFGKAACSDCHMVNGTGGYIASDLSSYGRTQSAEKIRDVLTNPNKNLDQRTKTVVVTTLDGHIFTGIARNEDNFSLQLQTMDGAFHSFEKSNLQSVEHRPESLMPADYGSRLSRQELDDLVGYLMTLGRKAQPDVEAGRKNTKRLNTDSRH